MRTKKNSWQWLSAASITLLMFSSPALAGDLNPSAPPGPTMKTLDQIAPTWDQILPASERFKPAMGGAAVLDRETGLVWEIIPGTTLFSWAGARTHCVTSEIAGRYGWRLPTLEEIASLLDTTVSTPPYLPIGHPFTVELNRYWSTNTKTDEPTLAAVINFGTGYMSSFPKSDTYNTWCVRGGHGYDGR